MITSPLTACTQEIGRYGCRACVLATLVCRLFGGMKRQAAGWARGDLLGLVAYSAPSPPSLEPLELRMQLQRGLFLPGHSPRSQDMVDYCVVCLPYSVGATE